MSWLPTRVRLSGASRDAGSSLVEIVVSLVVIAIVTTASLALFINNLHSLNGQSQRQQAVYLANQQLEIVQSVPSSKLVHGRTSAAVTSLLSTAAATKLKVSTQDDTTSAADFDPLATSSSVQTVPTQTVKTVGKISYSIYTFINACWYDVSGGLCGPTPGGGKDQEYRVAVDVRWTSQGLCTSGCDYSTSTLIDPTADPQFNSNISMPAGSYFSVGSNLTPGLTPNVVNQNGLTDSCAVNGYSGPGTKVVVTGTGFKSGIRVWISTGGGSIPTTSIYQPLGNEVDFCLLAGDVPGAYTISVINTDGGHFQLPITEIPSITGASGWTSTGRIVTLTGTGFQTGMTVSLAGGTYSTATALSAGNLGSNDSVNLTNFAGPKDNTTTTFTITNPSSTANLTINGPTVTSIAPSAAVAAGATKTLVLTGANFSAGLTAVVTNGNGSATAAFINATTASLTLTPTTVGTVTVNVYKPNGGYTSDFTIAVKAQPTVTGTSPSELTVNTGTVVTLTGTGFQSGATASAVSGGSVAAATTFTSATSIKLNAATATSTSPLIVLLTNPDGGTASVSLTVPSITSFTPTTIVHSRSYTWTVNGTGFETGATIAFSEQGVAITPTSVVWVSATKMTFVGTTTSTTIAGRAFKVTVTNPSPDNSSTFLTQTMSPS